MWRNRFAWILTLAALGFAASASATVSVSLVANCTDPFGNDFGGNCLPGTSVQLTARVTADAGELDDRVFGAINLVPGWLSSNGSPSQTVLPGDGWSANPLLCTTAFCSVFNQANSNGPTAPGVTDFAIGTISLLVDERAQYMTIINITWRTSLSAQRLDWFGLTNAPGTSVTVVVLPEPATGALLAMGLAGLALAGRRH